MNEEKTMEEGKNEVPESEHNDDKKTEKNVRKSVVFDGLEEERELLRIERGRLTRERERLAKERKLIAGEREQLRIERGRLTKERNRLAAERERTEAESERLSERKTTNKKRNSDVIRSSDGYYSDEDYKYESGKVAAIIIYVLLGIVCLCMAMAELRLIHC